jgi:hypothetical protein
MLYWMAFSVDCAAVTMVALLSVVDILYPNNTTTLPLPGFLGLAFVVGFAWIVARTVLTINPRRPELLRTALTLGFAEFVALVLIQYGAGHGWNLILLVFLQVIGIYVLASACVAYLCHANGELLTKDDAPS